MEQAPQSPLLSDVAYAGEYLLEFRYILANGDGDMSLSINGEDQGSINFWNTGGSSSWAWDRKAVFLKKGTNSVVIESAGLSPKLDHVNVVPAVSGAILSVAINNSSTNQVFGVSKLQDNLELPRLLKESFLSSHKQATLPSFDPRSQKNLQMNLGQNENQVNCFENNSRQNKTSPVRFWSTFTQKKSKTHI